MNSVESAAPGGEKEPILDWDTAFTDSEQVFNSALASVAESSVASPQPPQNPNLAPPEPETQPPAAQPQPPTPRPIPKPQPPKTPSPKPTPPQPTPPQPPKPQPTPPQPPAPAPQPPAPKPAAANNPAPAPANSPDSGLSGLFERVPEDFPEKTAPVWDPASGKKPSRQQVKSIESGLETIGSNLANDVKGFADETIETENGPVLLYDNDVLQAVINSGVDPTDRDAVEEEAYDIFTATIGQKNYQLSDEQRDEALTKIASDIEHIAEREKESTQNGTSYKDELATKIDAYRVLQSDLAQARAARQSKIGNSIRETAAKVKGFKPGLIKNTLELREQKEKLAYMGRAYGANVKKLAGIESKPTDKNGNPAPFRYDHRDIIDILKKEKLPGRNGAEYSQNELADWLVDKNGNTKRAGVSEVANDLRNELEKLRSKLGKYDSDGLDKISAEVDSYKQLKSEIETRQNEHKEDYGRIGSAALGGVKVLWGGAATAGYATKKLVINPRTAANIERTKKWAPWAKAGALAVSATVIGVGIASKDWSSVGSNTADFFSDLLSNNDEQPDATPAENDGGKVASGGLGDHIDAGRELRGLGPDKVPDSDGEGNNFIEDKIVTPETGKYTGELNSETGLMEGTASDSTARAVIELGVDYPAHQEDPEFQNDLYRLAVDSLEAKGVDQYEMPDNYQLELDKDSLQDFMDKWGPEEAPAADDANGNGDNPPQSVRTTDFSAEGDQDSNIEASQENTDIVDKISEIIPGFNPELISDFKDSIMANPNMIASIYSGTPITAQEALNYASIHNSLIAPPIDHGYAQFIDNIQRLMREFLEDES